MKRCQRTVNVNSAQTELVRLNQRQIVESDVAMDLIQFDDDFTSKVIEDIRNKAVNHFFRQINEIFRFFYHQIQDDCYRRNVKNVEKKAVSNSKQTLRRTNLRRYRQISNSS